MKKSKMYHLAQLAVVSSQTLAPEEKLETLWTLRQEEEVARLLERDDDPEETA